MSMKIRINNLPKHLPPNVGTPIQYPLQFARLEKDRRGALTLIYDYVGPEPAAVVEELERRG